MDYHNPAWREVETWIREHEITMDGHELASWSHLTELQRNEAYLKSVFIHGRGPGPRTCPPAPARLSPSR